MKPTKDKNAGHTSAIRAIRGIVRRARKHYGFESDGRTALNDVLAGITKHVKLTSQREGGTGRK